VLYDGPEPKCPLASTARYDDRNAGRTTYLDLDSPQSSEEDGLEQISGEYTQKSRKVPQDLRHRPEVPRHIAHRNLQSACPLFRYFYRILDLADLQ
jgi:hypothetical protein